MPSFKIIFQMLMRFLEVTLMESFHFSQKVFNLKFMDVSYVVENGSDYEVFVDV